MIYIFLWLAPSVLIFGVLNNDLHRFRLDLDEKYRCLEPSGGLQKRDYFVALVMSVIPFVSLGAAISAVFFSEQKKGLRYGLYVSNPKEKHQ